MKDLWNRIEDVLVEAAFQEEREITGRAMGFSLRDRIESLFAAISFAEENDSEDALEFLCSGSGYGGWIAVCARAAR